MDGVSLIATESLLYGVLVFQVLAFLLLAVLLANALPISGQLTRLPGNVLKTLKASLDLEPVHDRLKEIEGASTRAADNVVELDKHLQARADLENKLGVIQTLFGTVLGLVGAMGVDWAIHGGSILGVDSWALRFAIVVVPIVLATVVVPKRAYNLLYGRNSEAQAGAAKAQKAAPARSKP